MSNGIQIATSPSMAVYFLKQLDGITDDDLTEAAHAVVVNKAIVAGVLEGGILAGHCSINGAEAYREFVSTKGYVEDREGYKADIMALL